MTSARTRRTWPTRIVGAGISIAALGLLLISCAAGTTAAPATVTKPPQTITAPPVTASPVTTTTTEQHTLAPVTKVSIVQKTVVKTLPRVTVNHTTTVVKTPAPVTVTAQPPAAEASFGEGTELVGVDIQPGTYRSAGGSMCYWQRLSGASGDLDDVIANDIGTTHPVVQIASSDYAFDSSDCGDWTKIG